MKRLFFGLWPSDETRKQIVRLNQQIKSNGLKYTKYSNLHVTLIFLGNIDTYSEHKLRLMAEEICVIPFVLNFDKLNYWKKPHILCLSAKQYDPQLKLLVENLNSIAEQCNIKTESRAYIPHITLARKVSKPINIAIKTVKWKADSFCLIESCHTSDGTQYQILQRWRIE